MGQQAVVVAIAPIAHQPRARRQRFKARKAGGIEHGRMGGADDGLRQRGRGPGADEAPLSASPYPRPFAVAAEGLPHHGLMHEARRRLAIAQQTQQAAPRRQAGDEGPGAVNGIYDPAPRRCAALCAELFADDAVLRIAGVDALTDALFHRAVRLGYRVPPLLRLLVGNRPRGAKALRGDAARSHDGALAEGEKGFDFRHERTRRQTRPSITAGVPDGRPRLAPRRFRAQRC